ncbi:MAG: response regulator, partial [Pseudomonadales bacterium]|nr:response regulator [Pseudomonadales bacterium]
MLEHELRQSQKMQSIGRLAGGIAHDFNNMLSVILGNPELALENLDSKDSIYQELVSVQQAGLRAADLTRQLLGFARKQTIEPRMLDVNEVIGGMTRMLQRLIGENIELNWIPGADLPRIHMDPSQIDQILVNLVVNARDAIDKSGSITIETACVDVAGSSDAMPEMPAGKHVRLSITDDGVGMDEQLAGAIFEPFFTTKPPGQGTGLGLATVYGIARQNAGDVRVESEPGKGSTFHVYLPGVNDGDVTDDRKGEKSSSAAGKETILLVEDEASLLALLTRQLEGLGYTVIRAGEPREATNKAGSIENLDLLITDVVMPIMNGSDLYDELKKDFPSQRCVFISGYTSNV